MITETYLLFSLLQDGYCLISSSCYNAFQKHPSNPCLRCEPEIDIHQWTDMYKLLCRGRLWYNIYNYN